MKRIFLIAILGIALICTSDSLAPAQRFGGGHGGGGGHPGGGGGGRPNVGQQQMSHATPSFSRPSGGGGGSNRPAGGGFQHPGGGGSPGFAGARPNNMSRPGAGGGGAQNMAAANRPNMGSGRPGAGGGGVQNPHIANYPSQVRPGAGGGGVQNPNIANRPGAGGGGVQNPNIANRPGAGGGGVQNPNISTLPAQVRPGAGGGGVQNPIIANRPGNRPGAGGGGVENPIIANRPGNRPGAGGGGVENPIIANRPFNRPGAGGGGVENPLIANRPWNRPGAGGSGTERPIFDNRPNRPINNDRPNVNIGNRPNVDLGNRFVQNNVNNVNVNQWNQYNQSVNVNNNWFNHASNWNRPLYGGQPSWFYGRPWYGYYTNWHSGFWNFWSSPPSLWYGAGALSGFMSAPGDTVAYSNPYVDQSTSNTVVVQQALDYSSPIPPPPPDQTPEAYIAEPTVADDGSVPDVSNEAPPVLTTEDTTINDAHKQFDAAREAFKGGEYAKAQELVEKAIALLPSDATLHEFRALCLFAQKKYKDAAAGLYAVLAAGPGWNWDTMAALYPNPDTYTKQLRALEKYTSEHPEEAYAHFLQAYHYLVLGSKDAAVQQLKEVVKLQPEDKLSPALVKALTPGQPENSNGPPKPGTGA
jgi:tetratricopeptide (TPR) repeat protein